MTLIPTIYNADTLGIRPDLVGRPITNWKDLVDPAFKGKAVDPEHPRRSASWMPRWSSKSLGMMKYADKGNMTKPEIDKTIAFLIEHEESRPVPRLLEELRREREPDGLGRGRHPVDVVAGGRRRALQGHRLHLSSRWRKAIAPGAAASAWPST